MPDPIRVVYGDRVLYEAQPKQAELHRSTAKNVLFGGAAGGGKSHSLRWHLIMACLQYPGIRCLLLRRQFTELEQTHLLAIRTEIPPDLASYDVARHRLNFPNGSLLQFGHCNTDTDFASYLSTEWAIIAVDEGGQFTPYMLTMLPSRLRTTLPIRTQLAIGSNPGGVGHQFLMDRFILKSVRDGTKYEAADYEFIQSRVEDNAYIRPEYVDRLEALPEVEFRRYRLGDWNLPTGNLFGELDRAVHLVPYRMWPDARRVVTADWGWTAPAPAVWWQADAGLDDVATRHNAYREWAPTETTPRDWAAALCAFSEGEGVEKVILDSAAWDQTQNGEPGPAEQMLPVFRAAGIRLVPCAKGKDSVRLGVSAIRAYLQLDATGEPALTISDTCPGLWDALVSIQRGDPAKLDDPRAADVPAKRQAQTHFVDTVRYYVASRPAPAVPTHAQVVDRDPVVQALKRDERSLWEAQLRRAKAGGVPLVKAKDAFAKPKSTRYPWQRPLR